MSFAQLIIVKFLSEGGNWAGRLGIFAFSEALKDFTGNRGGKASWWCGKKHGPYITALH